MYGLRARILRGTTDGSGDVTVTDAMSVFGWLYAVEWIDGTLSDGNTAVLSVVNTPSGIDYTLHTQGNDEGNADGMYYPRTLEHDQLAEALTSYCHPIINGTLKLVIASGGAAKEGGCIVYYFQ